MKTTIIIGLFTLSISAFAQKQDTVQSSRPVQVSFFYPLGSNGVNSPQYRNYFSFNILYGINGGVDGFELGGLVNANRGDVNGMQVAGIANITEGHSNGLVVGGIANLSKDSSNTLSVAGIANVYGGNSLGMQFAGISNTVNGEFIGGQFAGISNTTTGKTDGCQVAGISNLSADLTGLQISLINIAKNVKGFQLGLINISESYENGVPFGLVNFVRDGFHAIELSGGESIYGNLAFKLGVEKLYTIYRAGYVSHQNEQNFTYGLGFGSMVRLTDKALVSLDLTGNHIVNPSFSPRLNILSRADAAFRFELHKNIALFAGPSFNIYVAENPADGDIDPLAVPYTFYNQKWWNKNGSTSFWIGGNAGLSFQF